MPRCSGQGRRPWPNGAAAPQQARSAGGQRICPGRHGLDIFAIEGQPPKGAGPAAYISHRRRIAPEIRSGEWGVPLLPQRYTPEPLRPPLETCSNRGSGGDSGPYAMRQGRSHLPPGGQARAKERRCPRPQLPTTAAATNDQGRGAGAMQALASPPAVFCALRGGRWGRGPDLF